MQSGEIITFYSFKGGVGRSFALANVAWVLASNRLRVLAIDWDLESPGLLRYFHPFVEDARSESSGGVLELLDSYVSAAVGTAGPSANPDIFSYIRPVHWEFQGGYLDVVGAGRLDDGYPSRLNAFPWQVFYEKLGGAAYLERLKARLREEYDYVLIDSRSGTSDTSGICTVQMPDKLVVCFTLNPQSLGGAARVAKTVEEQRRGIPLRIYPVPMRLERGEKELLDQGLQAARNQFCTFVPPNRMDYWSQVSFFYTPFYASTEVLAAFGDRSSRVDSVLGSAERLTYELTEGRVKEAGPISEEQRRTVLEMYTKAR